jgi:hypothetical protein
MTADTSSPSIRPRGGTWQFAQEEEALRASASNVPAWRLANIARKVLADVVY